MAQGSERVWGFWGWRWSRVSKSEASRLKESEDTSSTLEGGFHAERKCECVIQKGRRKLCRERFDSPFHYVKGFQLVQVLLAGVSCRFKVIKVPDKR